MVDKYDNFESLKHGETLGIDYGLCLADRRTSIIVLAPHGGFIERATSQIAKAIAGADYSFYCFEGLRAGRLHGDLHITSTLFDEPVGVALIASAETAIAIHGRADDGDAETVWMGGRDTALRNSIASGLRRAGYKAATDGHRLPGKEIKNICNRGRAGAGVQLEIPKTLRIQLQDHRTQLGHFAQAVRGALANR